MSLAVTTATSWRTLAPLPALALGTTPQARLHGVGTLGSVAGAGSPAGRLDGKPCATAGVFWGCAPPASRTATPAKKIYSQMRDRINSLLLCRAQWFSLSAYGL